MLIRSIMTSSPTTVSADASCSETWDLFQSKQLRRAPVMDGERVLGMVTDRDLKRVMPWTIEEQERRTASGQTTPVRSILAKRMLSIGPNDHLERAAQVMLRAKIGGLPVIDHGKLVGVITESDIFKLFVRRTLTQRGERLVLRAPSGSPRALNPASICVDAKATLFDLGMYPLDKGRTSVVMQVFCPEENGFQTLIDLFITHGYEYVHRDSKPSETEEP